MQKVEAVSELRLAHFFAACERIFLLQLLDCRLASLDPLLNHFAMNINKDEAQVLLLILQILLSHLVLIKLFLDWLLQVALVLLLEIRNKLLNFVVALFQRDFHHIYDLCTSQRRRVLTPEHLLGTEFSLVDI